MIDKKKVTKIRRAFIALLRFEGNSFTQDYSEIITIDCAKITRIDKNWKYIQIKENCDRNDVGRYQSKDILDILEREET